MVEKLSKGREWLSTQSLENLLNRNLVLDSKKFNSFLSVTKNTDALSDSEPQGESTSYSFFGIMMSLEKCVFAN